MTGNMELGANNPFKYRGYYYDVESGLYYLNSRYYDPVTGRFLNADGYVSTGQGIVGSNMFAYCGNNPVNRVDCNGEFWDAICNFVSTALTSIGNTLSSLTPLYAGCGGMAVIDGPLPFGDAAAVFGAIGLTLGAVAVGVYDAVTQPTATVIDVPKAEEKEKDKDKKHIPQQYNYWSAEILHHTVVPITPLTYSEAFVMATEEKNILCRDQAAAIAIVKFFPSARWDQAHGSKEDGYLDHYHLSSAHKSHIWYYG